MTINLLFWVPFWILSTKLNLSRTASQLCQNLVPRLATWLKRWNVFFSAWSKDDEDEDDETKRPFKSSYEIWVEYTEYSTWMGLIYIFFNYQTMIGRIFWIIVMILMAALGLYWCIKAYLDWQDKPVLTTITTTAFSVKGVGWKFFDSTPTRLNRCKSLDVHWSCFETISKWE